MSNTRFAKIVVAINCAIPGAILALDGLQNQLGADPKKNAVITTGLMAIIFLTVSLVITPLRRLTGWNWLISFRRTLGLSAFFYALAHFSIYFVFLGPGGIGDTIQEIFRRPYLVIGLIALLAMLPLAITSTNTMVKALGAKRWGTLHQLTYLAIVLGVTHYYLQAKSDKRQPTAFIVAAVLLLAYRWVAQFFTPSQTVVKSSAAVGIPGNQAPATKKPKFWTGQLRVVTTFDETPDVRTFRLAMPDGSALPFEHLPGQYLNVALMIDGKRVNRSYTIASSPTRSNYCELTIKRETAGVGSRHIHETIHQGDLLNVSAPAGRFTFTGEEGKSIVLIGGGVGITPLMSVIRYLTDRSWAGDIYLVYSARTQRDLIFQQELEHLQRRFPNLHVTWTLTRTDAADWTGARGRITSELLSQAIPNIAQHIVHVCGPTEMMGPVMQMLRDLGVPEDRIKSEAFQSAPSFEAIAKSEVMTTAAEIVSPAAPSSTNGSPILTLALSQKSVPVVPPMSILEAAESIGVDLNYECRSGICGQCKTKMLSGKVQMDVQDALSPKDLAENMILACQAKPLEDVTIRA